MVLSFRQSYAEQLVLTLRSLDLRSHLGRVDPQIPTLLLQVLYLLIILAIDLHETLEFILVPLQLVLQVDNPHILSQFLILLL